jgi:hypothetical protein
MPSFQELRDGYILGIIDSYDSIHSAFISLDNRGNYCHADFWPTQTHKKWRWDFDDGIHKFCSESSWTEADWDSIRTHITKKFGIKFWENGYHDLDYFEEKLKKEEMKQRKTLIQTLKKKIAKS